MTESTTHRPSRDSESENSAGLRRSWSQRIADRIFGFDFFISYAWKDGRDYAVALAKHLEAEGFDCFLDSEDYSAGDDWKKIGAWALRKTHRLVLLGTPGALESKPVLRELQLFSSQNKRVIPVDIDGCLTGLPANHPVATFLPDSVLRVIESAQDQTTGPSREVVESIRKSFEGERSMIKRLRWIRRVAMALGGLFIAASGFAIYALNPQHTISLIRQSRRPSKRSLTGCNWN